MNGASCIYMDYAASTPLDPLVLEVMQPLFMMDAAGNASALQNPHGQNARKIVDYAKEKIADSIGALPEEIFFTSGATEANNLAIHGVLEHLKNTGRPHIVTSRTEHASILMPVMQALKQGHALAFSRLLPCGMADGPFVLEEMTEQTGFISLQAVNNETGVVNPLEEVRDGIDGTDIIFHTDATQALGKIPFDVKKAGVHMATLSAHKCYGPQGIGALYIRKDIQPFMTPQLYGGGQQKNIRPGTFPVALIAGFGEACRIAAKMQAAEKERLEQLNAMLRGFFEAAGMQYKINGHDYDEDSRNWRVPGIMNIEFPEIENEWLLESIQNISFSAGSACSAQGDKSSHVLEAMGLNEKAIKDSVRISFGRFTTEEDIKITAQSFISAIKEIHQIAAAA